MSVLQRVESFFNGINEKRYYTVLLTSALIYFICVFTYATDTGTDGYIYQRVAQHITDMSGDWLFCQAFENAYWPPLFPFYLAGFQNVFGDNQYLFFIYNLIMLLGITLLSKNYLSKIFDDKTAMWGTLFFFLSSMMFKFVHYYKYEILSGLLTALALYFLLRPLNKKNLIFSSIFLGLGVLANGRLISLVPAICIYLFFLLKPEKVKRILYPLLFASFVVLTISPWTIRNYLCIDKFVFLSTNSGINFYMGFNPVADGGFITKDLFEEPYNTMNRTDHVAYYKGGIDFILENPGKAFLLTLKKINKLWQVHYVDMILFYPFFYVGIFILTRYVNKQKRVQAQLLQQICLWFTIFHLFFIARFYYIVPIAPIVYAVAVATQKKIWNTYITRKPVTEV